MVVPPRLAPLLAQFEFARDRLIERLAGMSDDEYLWEPAQPAWSIVPHDRVRTPRGFGKGDWLLEYDAPTPDPAPVTTIAWRVCHLASGIAMRADYTAGTHSLQWDDYVMPHTATAGVQALTGALAAWHGILVASSDANLDQVGRSSFPYGLDPDLPFLDICWWVNQELLHHGGELGLLRDLWAARE